MIILDCKQQSEEWFIARSGIPSASMFDKIITPGGKASTSAKGYMNQLLAEWLIGGPVDQIEANHWIEQGNEREAEARDLYQFISSNPVEEIGFCFKDDKKLVGCSPDGFVSDDGLLEIKSPKASTMVDYMLNKNIQQKYKPQLMGQLWITDRKWMDICAYHPNMEPIIVKVYRDESFITTMSGLLTRFIDEMLEKRERLKVFNEQ